MLVKFHQACSRLACLLSGSVRTWFEDSEVTTAIPPLALSCGVMANMVGFRDATCACTTRRFIENPLFALEILVVALVVTQLSRLCTVARICA